MFRLKQIAVCDDEGYVRNGWHCLIGQYTFTETACMSVYEVETFLNEVFHVPSE